MNLTRLRLKAWLGLTAVIFLLLILIHLALPALFLALQVPSFALGREGWILRWQNEVAGSGLQFNLIILLIVAIALGLAITLFKTKRNI
jgi:4-hydroxybenzoate polyprenyltransferase